ncbi:hypothetical protein K457DRAFT_1862026 [Linnemannia elongata AG-77]|uniref:Uncharacterized protein n=1 Tax=Linnemannia elongata AG-77 TaxID=1314771 RepID=A0A197K7B8_9FUNG|nr:hypothetical protein K457DRAFT_1862026 [Linnemannia elongata AG-77]
MSTTFPLPQELLEAIIRTLGRLHGVGSIATMLRVNKYVCAITLPLLYGGVPYSVLNKYYPKDSPAFKRRQKLIATLLIGVPKTRITDLLRVTFLQDSVDDQEHSPAPYAPYHSFAIAVSLSRCNDAFDGDFRQIYDFRQIDDFREDNFRFHQDDGPPSQRLLDFEFWFIKLSPRKDSCGPTLLYRPLGTSNSLKSTCSRRPSLAHYSDLLMRHAASGSSYARSTPVTCFSDPTCASSNTMRSYLFAESSPRTVVLVLPAGGWVVSWLRPYYGRSALGRVLKHLPKLQSATASFEVTPESASEVGLVLEYDSQGADNGASYRLVDRSPVDENEDATENADIKFRFYSIEAIE